MRCDEAQELITASVDNELSAGERVGIESHLADCHDCRMQLKRETTLKGNIKLAGTALAVPQALRDKIHDLTGKLDSDKQPATGFSSRDWFGLSRSRPIWAFAIAVIAIAALFYPSRPQQDVVAAAMATHESLMSGHAVLSRVRDPAQLREELALAVKSKFAPVALDLSMAKLYPVAGFVKKIGEREVLVTVYEGAGPAITCYTLLGTEADAPKNAVLFRDDDMGVNFYSFSRDHMNAVIHKEGEVICILISKMPATELLALLRGKARHA